MQTITITQDNAVKAFNNAAPAFRAVLTDLLGADTFKRTGTDWITNFRDVCEAKGKNVADYDVTAYLKPGDKVSVCINRLLLIAEVYNGDDWKADLSNTSQRKHYPYFNTIQDKDSPGGFRLSFNDSVYVSDYSLIGVRPYYKTDAISTHVGKLFISEYHQLAVYLNELLQSNC
jgi:hypothetical protein